MINPTNLGTTTPFLIVEILKSDKLSRLAIALGGTGLGWTNDKR